MTDSTHTIAAPQLESSDIHFTTSNLHLTYTIGKSPLFLECGEEISLINDDQTKFHKLKYEFLVSVGATHLGKPDGTDSRIALSNGGGHIFLFTHRSFFNAFDVETKTIDVSKLLDAPIPLEYILKPPPAPKVFKES